METAKTPSAEGGEPATLRTARAADELSGGSQSMGMSGTGDTSTDETSAARTPTRGTDEVSERDASAVSTAVHKSPQTRRRPPPALHHRPDSKAEGSSLTAIPASSGRVAAHSSARCVLSWQRPTGTKSWTTIPAPKMLLHFRFLDANDAGTADATAIRLMARVAPTGVQLLLDADTKPQGGRREAETPNDATQSASVTERPVVAQFSTQQLFWILAALIVARPRPLQSNGPSLKPPTHRSLYLMARSFTLIACICSRPFERATTTTVVV
ncbi:hypothetical protein M3Y99_00284200 [Aphelenchoides fujianensis]|nr:hypothetical protein M3Y99_00284200 [Aphelenchoides fujianensis]